MIKHENGKYVVYSESGRRFGSYETEAQAKKRLTQMEMFKHMKKTAAGPKMKSIFASEPMCKVHGAATKCVFGKAPSFSKKAEFLTPETAKILSDVIRKNLVKSYAKHKGKENVIISLKNNLLQDLRPVVNPSVAERKKLLKDVAKGTKTNFKNFTKGL